MTPALLIGRWHIHATRTATSRFWPVALLPVMLFAVGGCAGEGARWIAGFAERTSRVRTIEVSILSCDVHEMHTGEVLEPRADYSDDARRELTAALAAALAARRLPATRSEPAIDPAEPQAGTGTYAGDTTSRPAAEASFALLVAVQESILTHLYQHRHATTLEYSIGAAVNDLAQLPADSADALLCVELSAVVPSVGRQFFAATALAAGLLTQSLVHVRTHQAVLRLMLIDRASGDFLAHTLATAEIDVRNEDELRRFVVNETGRMLRTNE